MTRINDHDGCLANLHSLALEVSLQGSSSVTLLAQAEGEAACLSGRGRRSGRPSCEMREEIDLSLLLFHLLPEAQGCSWGWVGGLAQAQDTQEPPWENTGGGGWSEQG